MSDSREPGNQLPSQADTNQEGVPEEASAQEVAAPTQLTSS